MSATGRECSLMQLVDEPETEIQWILAMALFWNYGEQTHNVHAQELLQDCLPQSYSNEGLFIHQYLRPFIRCCLLSVVVTVCAR